jgi:uracil-DNA glycosylase
MESYKEFDRGPTKVIAKLFSGFPDYSAHKDSFWFDWGPVFYRGRLNKSAKVLCVASDPGPTERIGCRALIGNAGQRLQGFLAKLGITQSYLCLNALVYALYPSHLGDAKKIIKEPGQIAWRNKVFKKLTGSRLQVIIAFGVNAQQAVELWDDKGNVPVFNTYHPSYPTESRLLDAWRDLVLQLRNIVTPDSDGVTDLPNYGNKFTEDDYAPIPKKDLPFGLPPWFGDDKWGRTGHPKHYNCVSRPDPDDRHTLTWIAPQS